MSCKVFSSSDEYGLGGSGIQASKVGPKKTGSSSKSSKSDEEDSVEGDSDGDGDPSRAFLAGLRTRFGSSSTRKSGGWDCLLRVARVVTDGEAVGVRFLGGMIWRRVR